MSNVWLIKTDANGDTLWTKAFELNSSTGGRSIRQTSDGGYIVTGETTSFGASNGDVLLIKIAPDFVGIDQQLQNAVNYYDLQQNYPNPFNPKTKIQFSITSRQFVSLKVYDILGKEIAALVNEEKPAGEYTVEFNGSNLSSGIYLYRLQAGDPESSSGQGFVDMKKMILLR